MQVLKSLEQYQIPIIHDEYTFNLLSLIALLGPVSNDELKLRLGDIFGHYNKRLIQLYKSGLLISNKKQQWVISGDGIDFLSQVGVSQVTSSSLISKLLGSSLPLWLRVFLYNRNSTQTASSILRRLKAITWFEEETDFKIAERHKFVFVPSLCFSEKIEFYELDSKSFYNVFFKKSDAPKEEEEFFHRTYESCQHFTAKSNDFFHRRIDSISDISDEEVLFALIRYLSLAFNKSADLGVRNIKELDNKVILQNFYEWNSDSKNICTRFISENFNYRSSKDFESFLNKLIFSNAKLYNIDSDSILDIKTRSRVGDED